jgi:hypothetical protein
MTTSLFVPHGGYCLRVNGAVTEGIGRAQCFAASIRRRLMPCGNERYARQLPLPRSTPALPAAQSAPYRTYRATNHAGS